jgi:hypothetical protein
LGSDRRKDVGDCRDQGVDSSGGGLSQQSFELGEELFDRIEVGAVGRQVAQLRAGGLRVCWQYARLQFR